MKLFSIAEAALDEEEFGDGGTLDAAPKTVETPVSAPGHSVPAVVASPVAAPASSPAPIVAVTVAQPVVEDVSANASIPATAAALAPSAEQDELAVLKAKRAERFGIPIKEASVAAAPKVKVAKAQKAKAGQKQGTAHSTVAASTHVLDSAIAEKLKKRAERFGLADKATASAQVSHRPAVTKILVCPRIINVTIFKE